MHPKLMICGTIAAICAVAPGRCVTDPVGIANSIRSYGCEELRATERPLRPQIDLDEAARRIANGDTLRAATSKSGYRAEKSTSIHIRTSKGEDGIAEILVQRFCETISDSSLQDMGFFQRGDETWMVLAKPFSPPAPDDAARVGRHVLELINEARSRPRKCGRRKFTATAPLTHAAALEQAALVHAQDLAARNSMSHRGSDGSTPADRATRAGYAWAAVAENVAAGQTTAEEVVKTWLASPGHCENLMSLRYTETGVAYAVDPASEKGIYWVQVFAAQE